MRREQENTGMKKGPLKRWLPCSMAWDGPYDPRPSPSTAKAEQPIAD